VEWVEAFLASPAASVEVADGGLLRARAAGGDVVLDPQPGSPDDPPSIGDLIARALRSRFIAALDRQVPIGARVLDVGCGAGHLGLFLSIGGRAVVGVDRSAAALRPGRRFADAHGLANARFLQADLLSLPLREAAFDLVICRDVLDRVAEPRRALDAILRPLRPGGYVIVGVPRCHAVDEVMDWYDGAGVEFVRGVPSVRFGDGLALEKPLFGPLPRGGRAGRWITRLTWRFMPSRGETSIDVIGRKLPSGAVEER
jgi:SAM-dependent methyltransferase